MYTPTTEDYLKAIYTLQHKFDLVETSVLAKYLTVAAPSVTSRIQKMDDLGLVEYKPYAGVTLTANGEREALKIIRRHRLLEYFLVENLGLPWEQAHAEAENLEHGLSNEVTDLLEAYLDYPAINPHGAPIPNNKGDMTHLVKVISLSELPLGQPGVVAEVNDHDSALLRYLAHLRLYPGAVVCVLAVEPFGGSLKVEVDGVEREVGRDAAEQVFIAQTPDFDKNNVPKVVESEEDQRTQEDKSIKRIVNQMSPLWESGL